MYELTAQQENIWNLQNYYGDTTISNISGILKFKSRLDTDSLKKAINMYVQYQEGARLRFLKNGSLVQQYVEDYTPFDIPIKQFENLPEMLAFANKEARIPYEFGKSGIVSDKMYRFTIYETADACGIIIHMNHLISDAWTLSLFCRTVIEYYQMLIMGKKADIQTVSYIDYIKKEQQYLESEKYQKDAAYWNNRFTETPVRKRIKPESKEEMEISSLRLVQKVSKECTVKMRDFCDNNGYSPAILFESVIFTYLSRINESEKETIIGVPILNRTGRDKQIAGMFISTMPLGITVEPTDTMLQVCQKVSASHFEMFRHQRFPYSTILRQVRQAHEFKGNLYDVMVSYQNAVVGKTGNLEYETQWLSNGYSDIPMAFHIDDRDKSGCFTVNMDVQEKLFSKEEANWLLQRILFMADTVVANESITVENMPIMSEQEYTNIQNKFNHTKVAYDDTLCAHEVFEQQALLYGERTALICENQILTYGELSKMSDKLAMVLCQKGVTRGDIVPLIFTRSFHAIVAMLGIMKAGGAYLPIDYKYPNDRISYMMEEACASMVLCCGMESRRICETLGIIALPLEEICYESISVQAIDNKNEPEDTAYVIFTSGSTGKPKGTMLKHKGLVNFCLSNELSKTKSCVNILAVGSFSFDISLVEIFLPLLNGLTVTLASEEQVNDAEALAEIIRNKNIDLIHTTPTRLAFYMESQDFVKAIARIKVILVAGESLSSELHSRILKATKAKLFNGYGPTETTIGATFSRMDNKRKVTIGKPIANTQIYIVNQENQLCPIGVAGELCVSGNGVGAGYLNRPELTAEKFVPNPFATEENRHGATMYRTGDLARWRTDGEIEFLGRIDTQVKIRGLRIELGEIESTLASYPEVEFSAVADKRDEQGRQFLVGYYTAKRQLDETQLREYLEGQLPKYMVPNYLMQLKTIPVNISGKTDRKNLPMPDLSLIVTKYIPPQTEMESLLCNLYEQVLGVGKVGRTDHFFELGGDSLTAMTLIAHLADTYREVSLQWIFEKPVVAELCEMLEKQLEINHQKIGDVEKQAKHILESKNEYGRYQEFLSKCKVTQQGISLKKNSIPHPVAKADKEGMILTGATGFLGAHILKELLEQNEDKKEVYCLVRGETELGARKRLCHVMETYFDKNTADIVSDESVIHVIAGDITDTPIDCIRQTLKQYPSAITQILHTAALVKHYGDYENFYHVNVEGTKNMLAVAESLGAEFLHISTESVGGLYIDIRESAQYSNAVREFTEWDVYIGQNLDNVYIRSKFEAECRVLDYILAGGRARIFRVGNLTNRYSDGRFQNNYAENAFLRRMHTFLSLGAYPDVLAGLPVEFSPIDETARAIITLAMQKTHTMECIYHVSHSHSITHKCLSEKFHAIGKTLRAISVEEFLTLLQPGNVSHDYVKNNLNEMMKMSVYCPIVPVNEMTGDYLKEIGFVWSEIGEKYLKRYIEYVEALEL